MVSSRVELFANTRRDKRLDPDLSQRVLAEKYGVRRWTVRQALSSAVPPRKVPRPRGTVLDPAKDWIDAMLLEDLSAPRKQRHTARRIHQRLFTEYDFDAASYSTVKTRVDLTVAARTGQQLFIIGTLRPRGGLPPRANDQRPGPEPLGGRLHGVQPRWSEPSLFEMHRDLSGVSSLAPLLDPELAAALSTRAARIAELRGWPARTLGSVRRGIRILCAVHRPGEVILASTISQLTHTAVPANHVLEVFEDLEIFLDDRPDSLDAWCETHFASLAPDIRAELDIRINILRHGTSRRRPRARSTIITNLGSILPFLTEYAAKYTTLRQVTRDDVIEWLAHRPHRAYDASALRGLFRTLKAERLVFTNSTRGIHGGKLPVSIPLSLTADEVKSVAQAAQQEPALRVVVALSGIHALPAHRIRSLLLEEVDLPGHRLDPEDLDRPLDEYTAEAITNYLAYRHRRWPNSTNPHLLISRNTATTTAEVGTFWMDKLVKQLPVSVDRLRQDRILEEALTNGADPLHLAHVFSLGAKTSLRYTSAVTTSAAEQDSRPRCADRGHQGRALRSDGRSDGGQGPDRNALRCPA